MVSLLVQGSKVAFFIPKEKKFYMVGGGCVSITPSLVKSQNGLPGGFFPPGLKILLPLLPFNSFQKVRVKVHFHSPGEFFPPGLKFLLPLLPFATP